jgi:hypothetical protein
LTKCGELLFTVAFLIQLKIAVLEDFVVGKEFVRETSQWFKTLKSKKLALSCL